MTVKAVIITGQASETDSTQARNLLMAGGMTLFARQLKTLKAIGIEEVHVITDWYIPDFEAAATTCTEAPKAIFIHHTREAAKNLQDACGTHDHLLVLEEGMIVDQRILHAVMAGQHDTHRAHLAFLPRNRLPDHITAFATPFTAHNNPGFFGGIALIPATILQNSFSGFADATLMQQMLQNLAQQPENHIIDISQIPLYVNEEHADIPLTWMPLTRREDRDKATRLLLVPTDIMPRSWPEKLIYTPIENWLSLKFCHLPSTPSLTFWLRIIFSLLIVIMLAAGPGVMTLAGIFIAIIVSLGIGVGPKLAALKRQYHAPPLWQVWIARMCEYGWFLALGSTLALAEKQPLLFALALIVVLFQAADDQQRLMFRVLSHRPLRRVSKTDQRLHSVLAERDTLLWAILPFLIVEEWQIGLIVTATYSVISFFIRQTRLKRALQNKSPLNT